jgi:hypothetical protein
VIHPTGDHDHRSYFLHNQEPAIRMERSTDFFRLNLESAADHGFFTNACSAIQQIGGHANRSFFFMIY